MLRLKGDFQTRRNPFPNITMKAYTPLSQPASFLIKSSDKPKVLYTLSVNLSQTVSSSPDTRVSTANTRFYATQLSVNVGTEADEAGISIYINDQLIQAFYLITGPNQQIIIPLDNIDLLVGAKFKAVISSSGVSTLKTRGTAVLLGHLPL